MSDLNDGAIPRALIEQREARSVDPGKLQLLGKQAAALYSSGNVPLSDAVVQIVGREDLGPEHTKRICEFANQEAFKLEWDKCGSIRNVEFDGGPADPSVVIKELNDGARQDAVRVVSDYDRPPEPLKLANRRVEEEIFSGYTEEKPFAHEQPGGVSDLVALYDTIKGAEDHVFSKMAGLEVALEQIGIELGDEVGNAVLEGESLSKVAGVWKRFESGPILDLALETTKDRLDHRQVPYDEELEKTASVGRIPNTEHPVIAKFLGFVKVASEYYKLLGAVDVLKEKRAQVDPLVKCASPMSVLMAAPRALGAAGKAGAESLARSGVKNKALLGMAHAAPHAAVAVGGHQVYTSPTGRRVRYKIQEMKARRAMRRQQRGMRRQQRAVRY